MENLQPHIALSLAAFLLAIGSMAVWTFNSPRPEPIESARGAFEDHVRFGLASEPLTENIQCDWEANAPAHSETQMVLCNYDSSEHVAIRAEYHFNENNDFVYANLLSPNNSEAE